MNRQAPKIGLLSFALMISSLSAARPAGAQEWSGNVNLLGGLKLLDDDWKPAEDQIAYGLQTDFMPPEWPFSLAVDLLLADSASESVELPGGGSVTSESETMEVDLGIRKYWHSTERWRPFLGGGLALLRGELETRGPIASASDSDTGTGLWAGGGVLYAFNNHLNVGVQGRYSTGDVDINGAELDAGGLHFGGLVGFYW